jgi:hypothetical protein
VLQIYPTRLVRTPFSFPACTYDHAPAGGGGGCGGCGGGCGGGVGRQFGLCGSLVGTTINEGVIACEPDQGRTDRQTEIESLNDDQRR